LEAAFICSSLLGKVRIIRAVAVSRGKGSDKQIVKIGAFRLARCGFEIR